jgi:glucose dehydrogenase
MVLRGGGARGAYQVGVLRAIAARLPINAPPYGTLTAVDMGTGTIKWQVPLGEIGYANPMTWRGSDGVQRVAIATGAGTTAKLMVFALP